MRPELADPPRRRDRFLREARAAARVEHDNVVPIYQVGEDGGPFLVMPLLEGESLEARLKRDGRLPPAEVLRIGREVGRGLAAAHARGWSTGTSSRPTSGWRRPDGRVKVLDFGLARPAAGGDDAADRSRGGRRARPAYMAPEQADGEAVDHRADLFSLGVRAVPAADRAAAFAGPDLTAVLRAVGEHAPPPPAGQPGRPGGPVGPDHAAAGQGPGRPPAGAGGGRRLALGTPAPGTEPTATWVAPPARPAAGGPRGPPNGRRTVVISFCLLSAWRS